VGCWGVGSTGREADGAGTSRVDGGEGLGEGRLAEVEDAGRGYGVAEAGGTGSPDTVEHVGAEGDGDKEIFGVALGGVQS